jgi:hypothetical protein
VHEKAVTIYFVGAEFHGLAKTNLPVYHQGKNIDPPGGHNNSGND